MLRIFSTRVELPPRARRIPLNTHLGAKEVGTTSACAENTQEFLIEAAATRNYLRVRGEYVDIRKLDSVSRELPPRARRILRCLRRQYWQRGTTSACAENTLSAMLLSRSLWNYLRVRGEYPATIESLIRKVELPPRARRIPITSNSTDTRSGTTSACAENTASRSAC